MSEDPKYRIIDGQLPRPNFDPPSLPGSINQEDLRSELPSSSSDALYDSPLSKCSRSIVDNVQLLVELTASDISSTRSQLDYIPPQQTQNSKETASLISKVKMAIDRMDSSTKDTTSPALLTFLFVWRQNQFNVVVGLLRDPEQQSIRKV